MGDSLDTSAALTTPLQTVVRAMVLSPAAGHGDGSGHASGTLGACRTGGRSDGRSGGNTGEAPCSQTTAPLRLQAPQPNSSDSCKAKPFLQGEVQNTVCFHVTSARVSTTLEHFLPCCATCCGAGAHPAVPAGYRDAVPCCWGQARSLLGFPWDEACGGFHPSLATSHCCLMLRASFLSINSPEYVTVKVTHGSRTRSFRF